MELFVFLQFPLPATAMLPAISPAPLQWTTTCKKTHGDGEDQDRRPNL